MSKEATKHRFGTFGGVFTPSILTILGVIMFLRTGYVVGQAGIRSAVIILLVAEVITVLTALSLGAIATNTPVKGGGAYFLISRSLGPEFGGSIGLALFLAQALSVPFYVLGFTDALVQSFPVLQEYTAAISIGTGVLLFVINYVGAQWAIKAQYIVMTLLGLAVAAFLGGAAVQFKFSTLQANWAPGYTEGVHFGAVFALFFPAVTGILAGVNMSGDLKDPAKSLVRGTLLAIGVGFLIYLSQMLLCGGSQARPDLIEKPYRMLVQNALFGMGFFVMGGVFAATLSSAMGSFLGAPRVLQAIARDRIFPGMRWFARGSAKHDEPRAALWLTLVMALAVMGLASGRDARAAFDIIASVVAMFFLGTYGMINLAAFVESFGDNPSFRPTFRWYHWSTSLLGAAGCLAAMIMVDALAATAAAAVVGAVYYGIKRRLYRADFGDARKGLVFSLVLDNLSRLSLMSGHPKNWRPIFLVLGGNIVHHLTLIRYADWMEGSRGIVTAAQVLVGDLEDLAERRRNLQAQFIELFRKEKLTVFPEVVVARSLDEGIRVLAQAHSIGPIKPNTVLLGWPSKPERIRPFTEHVRMIRALGKSVVAVADRGVPAEEKKDRRIDLWWRGQGNGSLMLILAHLLRMNWAWRNARIRILRAMDDDAGREPAREALKGIVRAGRIEADVVVMVAEEPFENVLYQYSREADVVFLGFNPPDESEAPAFHARFTALTEHLPTTILVSSSGEADLLA